MRTILGKLALVFVLGIGCSRSGGDVDAPTAGEGAAGDSVAPVESEPTKVETPDEPVDPNMCVLVKGEWEACDGKLVQVDGTNADMVQQHPMMNGPDTEQGYLDVEGVGQIIIVSHHAVDCSGAMRVVGTLRAIDLGGAPGTKESYKGWVIEHAQFTCR